MSSKADQFSDLLAGFTSAKKDTSKLSLEEKLRLSSTNTPLSSQANSDQWANFDILSQSASNRATPASTKQSSQFTSTSDLFEGFDVLNGTTTTSKPQNQSQPSSNEDLFEGFPSSSTPSIGHQSSSEFDLLDSFGISDPAPQRPVASQSTDQNLDDIFAAFDKPVQQSNIRPTVIQHQSNQNVNGQFQNQPTRRDSSYGNTEQSVNNDKLDESIASLIDMGFSIEQATDALKHTSNGTDVQQAISYIMNKAHNTARAKSGLPAEERLKRQSTKSTGEQYIRTFSSLVNKATDKIANDFANRFFTPPPDDGRPLWMRDQAKHRARATQEYDEDPEELSPEALERLSLDSERRTSSSRPHPPAPRKKSNASTHLPSRPRPQQQQQSQEQQQQQHRRPVPKPQPEPEVDIFSPLPVKPRHQEAPIVDLFSPIPTSTASSSTPSSSSNEMRTSSRRRTTAPTPSSTPKITRPFVPISQTQLEFFNDSRKQGGISFKNGDFSTALTHYQTALEALPPQHILRIIAYSNVITAYFKVGDNKKVIDHANEALTLIGPNRGVGEEVEPGKPMKDLWIKITQRKAEALELLEKFKDSLDAWNELIENGSATKVALDGKRRCQNVLNPKPKQTPRPSPSPANSSRSFTQKPQPFKSTNPGNSKALKNLQESNKESEKFEEEKFKLKDDIDARINKWKNGKDDNIRALLASLQDILWESSGWKPVGMSDLVMPKKVKVVYLKAVSKVHPDKIPKTASPEQKIIAESVFVVINLAWESFKTANGIQ